MSTRTIVILVATILVLGMALTAFYALRVSSEILDEFKKVNDGLETTQRTLTGRQSDTRTMIQGMHCNLESSLADSIHRSYVELVERIERFKTLLAGVPRDNTTTADSLFAANDQGSVLYHSFRNFFNDAERICVNSSIDQQIAFHAEIVRSQPTLEEWRTRNFVGIPAIACSTLLAKFRSDAASTELLVLKDLLEQCDPAAKR